MIFKVCTFFGLLGCLTIVYLFETAGYLPGLLRIFHWPAMVLTGLGPSMLVCVCSEPSAVKNALSLVFGMTPVKRNKKYEREALFMHQIGQRFYVEGPKVFEDIEARGMSKFLIKSIERMSVRMPMIDIREFLENERDKNYLKTSAAINVISMGVRLCPSVGMLGTILGMVQLLSNLKDPSNIGGHMSLALLTTFYGLFFSLAMWTPLQQKLERVSEAENHGYNQAVRWLELLEKRKPANYFADSVGIALPQSEGSGKTARPKAA